MTPLIDVMLVLLVIFIMASPLLPRQIGLELPKASLAPQAARGADETPPPVVSLSIDAAGRLQWNGADIDATALSARMHAAASADPQPQIALRADQRTPYARIAQVMAVAQREGLTRFGFVVDSPASAGAAPK
ncbi:biopolymer transporter ExbD [Robbsia sp. KACC 23696]|uniref:ExbD/TolR family protein n=1 Tax=Robbsia sp. KACC 23696 TaxID=3149231 RepID=UPI00325BEE79